MNKPGPERRLLPIGWRQPVTDWTRELRAQGRPASTVYLRTNHLRRFAYDSRISDPYAVTFDDLLDWLSTRTDWAI